MPHDHSVTQPYLAVSTHRTLKARLARGTRHLRPRDAIVAVAITAAIVSGYVFETRPRSTDQGALVDLYRSPVCIGAGGQPLAGSPTVAQAWQRTIGTPVAQAKHDFVGMGTIELRYSVGGNTHHLAFYQVGAHGWLFNEDVETAEWVRGICGAAGG